MQNGFDNSGHTGPANWANDQNNIGRTKAVISTLAREFSQQKWATGAASQFETVVADGSTIRRYAGVVTSISLINEPAPFKSQNILEAVRLLSLSKLCLDALNAIYPGSPVLLG